PPDTPLGWTVQDSIRPARTSAAGPAGTARCAFAGHAAAYLRAPVRKARTSHGPEAAARGRNVWTVMRQRAAPKRLREPDRRRARTHELPGRTAGGSARGPAGQGAHPFEVASETWEPRQGRTGLRGAPVPDRRLPAGAVLG